MADIWMYFFHDGVKLNQKLFHGRCPAVPRIGENITFRGQSYAVRGVAYCFTEEETLEGDQVNDCLRIEISVVTNY